MVSAVFLIDIKCTGKGGTTHGADRQADTDLRPQSG